MTEKKKPKRYSVLLKTVVNMRFSSIEAPNQATALKKIERETNGLCNRLFRNYRISAGKASPISSLEMKDGQTLKLRYTEWAEDHQCALVDEDGDTDFVNSEWYDYEGDHWYPSVDVPRHDKNCFMEMAGIALSRHRDELGDLLDISDEELDRLEKNLKRYLGGPNYGKESSSEKDQEETGKD